MKLFDFRACTHPSHFHTSEMNAKLETEKSMRHKVEARLLDSEKKNSEMSVDLMQLQKQVGDLQKQLQAEMEKVSKLF